MVCSFLRGIKALSSGQNKFENYRQVAILLMRKCAGKFSKSEKMGAKFMRTTSAIQKRDERKVLPQPFTPYSLLQMFTRIKIFCYLVTGCHEKLSRSQRCSDRNSGQCHCLCSPKRYYAVQFLTRTQLSQTDRASVAYHDLEIWFKGRGGAADFKVGYKTGFVPHFSKCGV